MSELTLAAQPRSSKTKSDVRKARGEGKIPAVVYGKIVANEPIFVDEKELSQLLRTNPGGVVRMHIPNYGELAVMVNEVQRDKVLQNKIVHVDFHQIDLNEMVKATVRIELVGEPKGVEEGGILQQMHNTVDLRCRASSIPSVIQADVSGIEIGDHLFARDVPLPAGVELKSDPNDIIATVLAPQKELPESAREENEEVVRADAGKEAELQTAKD